MGEKARENIAMKKFISIISIIMIITILAGCGRGSDVGSGNNDTPSSRPTAEIQE
ncbi:MAG: hypothetical protein FWH14_08620 [Oscillospiraceae bacterium]|nr:hypothetical protein [Oscillospiraceae bacterium]